MYIYCGERCSGKTTSLVKRASENGGLIITADRKRVEIIKKIARDLDVYIREPMSFEEYMDLKSSFYRQRQSVPILIDDAEDILQRLLGYLELDSMTVTCEDLVFLNK